MKNIWKLGRQILILDNSPSIPTRFCQDKKVRFGLYEKLRRSNPHWTKSLDEEEIRDKIWMWFGCYPNNVRHQLFEHYSGLVIPATTRVRPTSDTAIYDVNPFKCLVRGNPLISQHTFSDEYEQACELATLISEYVDDPEQQTWDFYREFTQNLASDHILEQTFKMLGISPCQS